MGPPKKQGKDACLDSEEMQRLNNRVEELAAQRKKQMQAAEAAQKQLKCVEWEHSMSEAAAEWYRLRCEECKAAEEAKESQARWESVKCELERAAQIAQSLHDQKPDC